MDEQSLFLQALEKPAGDERSAWLEEACGSKAALRERIETLLQRHEEADRFLENPAPGLQPTIATDASGGNRAAALGAGLASAFTANDAVVLGDANHSVLKMLDNTINEIPRISLRESATEGADPIERPSSPEIPNQLSDSRYRLDGEIARGGMGAIIKGRDTDLGGDLAI